MSTELFNEGKVRSMLKQKLADKLMKEKFNEATATELSKQVTSELLQGCKEFKFDDYKLIVHVSLGELRGQGMRFDSQSFWDNGSDVCVAEVFQNKTLYCCATVYGVSSL